MRALKTLFTSLAVASATSLHPRQYSAPDNSTENDCTATSLTFPRWYIYDPFYTVYNYSSGGRTGYAGFGALNAGLNVQANCIAHNFSLEETDTVWYPCDLADTYFSLSLNTSTFGVTGSWTCNDNDQGLIFNGTGFTYIPLTLGCYHEDPDESESGWEEDSCLIADTGIAANLTSPVTISPFQPWWVWPEDDPEETPRCVDRSQNPTWNVTDFFYNHTTTNGQHALTVNFTSWSNYASAICAVTIDDSQSLEMTDQEHWLDCGPPADDQIISTSVMFDVDYGLLAINQTWKCNDSIPPEPDTYSGLAYLIQPFDCTTAINHSYTCTQSLTNLTGWNDPPDVPHTEYSHSCTVYSINITSMVLEDYKIESSSGNATETGSFTVYNPASDDKYHLDGMPVQDDGAWHECVKGADLMPWQLVSCSYSLDRSKNLIGFAFAWFCDDLDPDHAILFNATATGQFPEESCSGNTCSLPTNSSVNLNVTTSSWTSTNQPMGRGPPLPWI